MLKIDAARRNFNISPIECVHFNYKYGGSQKFIREFYLRVELSVSTIGVAYLLLRCNPTLF